MSPHSSPALKTFMVLAITMLAAGIVVVVSFFVLVDNNRQGDKTVENSGLLVDCVTPGPNPPPITGHECWDRLHDPENAAATVSILLIEGDCRHRRALAGMDAPPDLARPCADQTPAEVYPGVNRRPVTP